MYDIFKQYLDSKIALTTEESAYIRSFCILKRLRKKQYLLQEGDVWKYNAFITKGCLRTYAVDERGHEHIIAFAVENWWTGDRESLLLGEPSKFNIDAIEESEVILISKSNFAILCKEIPAFNDMVNAILQRSFIASQNRIHASISYSAEEKYLNFLNKYPGLALRIPQNMIASYLGITPETLSRLRSQTPKR